MAHRVDDNEPNQENIGRLIEDHMHKWDDKKGGAWFIEDFMSYNGLWFTEFRKDLAKVMVGLTPKRLADMDEVRKHLLAYFKPKLLKPGAKPRNIPAEEDAEEIRMPKKITTKYNKEDCERIVDGAASKNEAMSRLRKAGYANKDIATFMNCKPGRVASGIRSYDSKPITSSVKSTKVPIKAEVKQPKPPELW